MKMKNNRYKFSLIALTGMLLAFLLGSCANPFSAPSESQSGTNADGSSTVKITVAKAAGARTLLPATPKFIKYRLEFSTSSEGVTNPAPQFLDGTNAGTFTLEPANWHVDVFGIVSIGGSEYEAAFGDDDFTLNPGQQLVLPRPITISASLSGADGFLSYSLDIQTPRVNDWELHITPLFSGTDYHLYSWYGDQDSDSIFIDPGYYLVHLQLYTDTGGTAVRTEIAHIYSGLETPAEWTFTDRDFDDRITVGGALDLTGLADIVYIRVDLYSDPEYSNQIDYLESYGPAPLWSFNFPAFSQAVNAYIQVVIAYNSGDDYLVKNISTPVQLGTADKTDINLGPFDLRKLTISGSISNVTLSDFSDGEIELFSDQYYNNYISWGEIDLSTGEWSIELPVFDTPTDVYTKVWLEVAESGEWIEQGIAAPISGVYQTNVSGKNLILNINKLNFSGSLNWTGFTDNGLSFDYAEVRIYDVDNTYDILTSKEVSPSDAAWSASLYSSGPVSQFLAVLTVDISYGVRVQEQRIVDSSVGTTGIDFAPGSVAEGSWTERNYIDNYDYLLFIPSETGSYILNAEAVSGSSNNPYMVLLDADGYDIAWDDNSGGGYNARINETLTVGQTYVIVIFNDFGNPGSYRFKAQVDAPPVPVTLGGTVTVSNLSFAVALDSQEVKIYEGTILRDTVTVESGSWSANVNVPPGADLLFILDTVLEGSESDVRLYDKLTRTITGDTDTINFAPAPIAIETWRYGTAVGDVDPSKAGDFFLLKPSVSGSYVLDAEHTGDYFDTYLSLYDGITGSEIAADDDGGDEDNNSRLMYALASDHPYIVQVREYTPSDSGAYRFRAHLDQTIQLITLSGTVDFGELNVSNAQIFLTRYGYFNGGAGGGDMITYTTVNTSNGEWSVSIPAFDTPTDVYFTIGYVLNGSPEPVIAGVARISIYNQSNTSISLAIPEPVTLGGTVDFGELEVANATIALTLDRYYTGYGSGLGFANVNPSTGAWSVSIPAFDTPTYVYVTIGYQLNGSPGFEIENATRISVSDQDIADINFSVSGPIESITLSGTLPSLLLNDDTEPPFFTNVIAVAGNVILGEAELNPNRSWFIDIPGSAEPRTVYFYLQTGDSPYGPFIILNTGISRPVSDESISSINLGNISALTANVQVSVPGVHGQVYALKTPVSTNEELLNVLERDTSIIGVSNEGYGSFNLEVVSSTPQNIWFLVLDYNTYTGYITNGAVSRNGTVNLNLSQMINLGELGPF
jgi:hypothetical protein